MCDGVSVRGDDQEDNGGSHDAVWHGSVVIWVTNVRKG